MKWIEFSVVVNGETAEAVSDLFSQYGHGGGVAIQELEPPAELLIGPQTLSTARQVRIATYAPIGDGEDEGGTNDGPVIAARQGLRDGLAYLSMIRPLGSLEERSIADEDWEAAWRDHFHTHRVARRSVVVPTWREYEPEPNDIIIRLDPGMAFGTGLHPTTQLCAMELERRVEPGMTILDVGCGSGILSLIAARLGASNALGLDIDPVAAKVARENVALNELSDVISIREGSLPRNRQDPLTMAQRDWPQTVVAREGWDIVAANLTVDVLEELAAPLALAVRPGGLLIGSGIIADRFDQAAYALMDAGLRLIDGVSDAGGDWRAIVLMRPASQGTSRA